jgi:hypothetical protein
VSTVPASFLAPYMSALRRIVLSRLDSLVSKERCPHHILRGKKRYSPECVEGDFFELRPKDIA